MTPEQYRQAEPIIHYLARKASLAAGTEYEDMAQEGWIGVMRAAEKWSPDGGASWTTYLRRGAWMRMLKANMVDGTIKTPYNARMKHWRETGEDMGRVPIGSLDAPIRTRSNSGASLLLVESTEDPSPEHPTEAMRDAATAALRMHEPREVYAYILRNRLGWNLTQVGAEFGISRQRASTLVKRAEAVVGRKALRHYGTTTGCPGHRYHTVHGDMIEAVGLCVHCWGALHSKCGR